MCFVSVETFSILADEYELQKIALNFAILTPLHTPTPSHTHPHSLQQFVKGTGSFVSEMADAVLNGLTNGRHSKFTEKFRSFEESERRAKASLRLDGGGGGGGGGGKAGKELSQRVERPSSTPLPASGNGQKNDGGH